jgi:hypothetical protein
MHFCHQEAQMLMAAVPVAGLLIVWVKRMWTKMKGAMKRGSD